MSMNIKTLIIAVFPALTTLCFAADVEWLNATDGAWGVGANWNGGAVPNFVRAVIANESSGFTVSVAETSNPKIAGLLLQNGDGTFTNTVRVTGSLSSENDDLSINSGGLLHIDGGTLAVTNSSAKSIIVSGTSAKQMGVLKVSGGILDCHISSVAQDGGIKLNKYGCFEATGGKILLTAPYPSSNNTKLGLSCESAAVSYDAMFIVGTAEFEIANRSIDLRVGRYVLGESARLICSESRGGILYLKANSTYGITFTVSGDAEFDLSKFRYGNMGSYYWANQSYTSILNVSGGTVALPQSFCVGHGNGSSIMNISGGTTTLDFYGLDVGTYDPDKLSSKAQNPVGTINVSGGSLVVTSSQGGDNTTAKSMICGLVVGNGSQISTYCDAEGYSCSGTLTVSDGVVTNGIGLFVIGAGRATGRMLQTGGEVYHGLGISSAQARENRPMIVGFAGGTGTYVISNGVTTVNAAIYVGGVETNVLKRKLITNWPGDEFADRTAVGKLVVAGGTLNNIANDLVVGADGSGTLEVGPGATVSVGRTYNNQGNIVLSNRTESVTRFVLGSDGVGVLTTPNKLIVANGAKLEVDVSDYTGMDRWVKLINCAQREGSFADADISVVGKCPRGNCKVVQDRQDDSTGSVWLYVSRGFVVSFK